MFGLASKEFTPAQVKSIFDNLGKEEPKKNFVVGIVDDVTNTSLDVGPPLNCLPTGTKQCMFWGLGTDGTIGANKEAIKVIGSETDLYTQGHFAYDSHKGGGVTMSHLRFGPEPIKSEYEIEAGCDYVACHNTTYIKKYDILKNIRDGGIFVLNSPYDLAQMEEGLPDKLKREIFDKNLSFYNIDATKIAKEVGLGQRINTVMQSVFYNLSEVLPKEEAMALLKESIERAYSKKGPEIVAMNNNAVDTSVANVFKIDVPAHWGTVGEGDTIIDVVTARNGVNRRKLDDNRNHLGMYPNEQFVNDIMDPVVALKGDDLPVSVMTPGGYMTSGSCNYEKRGIAPEIPVWIEDTCTQCNYCTIVCPHGVIRPFLLDKEESKNVPEDYQYTKAQGAELGGLNYSIQLATMDCTGCAVCTESCPDDSLFMAPYAETADKGVPHWEYSLALKDKAKLVDKYTVKGSQFQQPLLEFSGACAGCGETPYVKLLTQLYGERLMIANASGCSSVWGGTSTTNPYTTHTDTGKGPAWGRSLFEDNAEYGFGMFLSSKQRRVACAGEVETVLEEEVEMSPELNTLLTTWLKEMDHPEKSSDHHAKIVPLLENENAPRLAQLKMMTDLMPTMSQWIIGGDGWAYDIGYGGVDHVLSRGENVNIMVLDTEMYSNTGGQLSKSTPTAAEIKFASTGKEQNKKDLGQMAMSYGNVYVASVAMGADYAQCLKAIKEAEEYNGPSLITCYSPCIDWGLDMKHMMQIQKTAVDSGYWSLYRFDPRNHGTDKPAFQLDSRRIKTDLEKYLTGENRFKKLMRNNKDHATMLQDRLNTANHTRHAKMVRMSLSDEDLLDMLKEQVGESTGEKVTILYASETGTTEQLAQQLQYEFKRREVRTQAMAYDDLDIMDLPKHTTVINLVATCGQGEFPGNSKLFWEQVQDPELPEDFLANTKFATFAMGDSHYVFFNECGKQIDDAFAKLGGQRMMDLGLGDDQDDDMWETTYVDWEPDLFNELGTKEPPRELLPPTHTVNIDSGAEPESETVVPFGAELVKLQRADLITPGGRENIHYEFNMGNTSWECGDCLGVYPHAQQSQVEEFCDFYGANPNDLLRIEDTSGLRKPPLQDNMTVGQLFGQVLDMFGRPKRRFYDMLEMVATDAGQKAELAHVLTKDGAADMRNNFIDETMTHADLLRKFDSAKVPIETLIDFVPVIKPRLYSIASASLYTKEMLHLCIVADDWTTPSGKYQHGMCTNYLKNLQVDGDGVDVAVRVNPAAVTMPPDFKRPMMMCGLGTGYAPFRAFMQERLAAKQSGEEIGPMSLFFGARHAATEYLYQMPHGVRR